MYGAEFGRLSRKPRNRDEIETKFRDDREIAPPRTRPPAAVCLPDGHHVAPATRPEASAQRHRLTASARPRSPGALVRESRLSKGVISKLIDRLTGKLLVTRTALEADRRHQEVELTPEGRALVPRLAHLADDNGPARLACARELASDAMARQCRSCFALLADVKRYDAG